MVRDDETVKGWRRYKHLFIFGSAARIEVEPEEDHTPCTCTQEVIGFGCFCSFVDVDTLDQQ